MTREEEIYKSTQKFVGEYLDGLYDAETLASKCAKWADEHPNQYSIVKYLISLGYIVDLNGNVPTFEEVCKQLENFINYKKMLNPWRDAKTDPPKDNVQVFASYITSNGLQDFAKAQKIGKIWYIDNNTSYFCTHNVEYWMPIPETPKGGE